MRVSKLFRQSRTLVSASTLNTRSTSRSHVGHLRTVNEDRVLDHPAAGLWAIADGMGGHADGSMAAETVTAHLGNLARHHGPSEIDAALEAANCAIMKHSGGKSGTTIVVLRIDEHRVQIWWAGDSRAYLIRDGQMELLTRDHSLVQELVEAGEIAADQADTHPRAHIITRALGTGADVDIDRTELNLLPGDLLLLCSDGLSRSLVSDDLGLWEHIDGLADRLMNNALQRDGSDNISLVLVEVLHV